MLVADRESGHRKSKYLHTLKSVVFSNSLKEWTRFTYIHAGENWRNNEERYFVSSMYNNIQF